MATLYCPKCGYNLTGLTVNRCPECGEVYDPAELEYRQNQDAAGVIKSTTSQIIIYPIFFAAFAWILALIIGVFFVIIPVEVNAMTAVLVIGVAASALPILDGCRLGKRYARARLTYRFPENTQPVPRPAWMYPLLFSAAEYVLMVFYFIIVYILIVGG